MYNNMLELHSFSMLLKTFWRHMQFFGCKQTTPALPFPERLVGSYIEKLFEGKREARLVICGSFGLHMHDGLFEDLLVTNIGLDQSPEARNDSISLLIELEEEAQRHT